MPKVITNDEFLKRVGDIFGDRLDFSKSIYTGAKKFVTVVCPIHGEFQATPDSLLHGHGCPKCGKIQTSHRLCLSSNEVFNRANKVHNYKYDYSEAVFQNVDTKMKIICPLHGEFWQTPYHHINRGQGCPKCHGFLSQYNSIEQYIKEANTIHNYKYDYSKVNSLESNITLICHEMDDNGVEHGEFNITAYDHLSRHCGCPKCTKNKPIDTKEFIKRAKKVHGDKYIYDKTDYRKSQIPVIITCPVHGDFIMTPNNHLNGRQGCPKCSQSKLENEIELLLKENNINYITQKSFEWLKYKSKMFLDFYLPEYNIAIECQGGQHYFPVDYFGGEKDFKIRQERDKIKKELCNKNGIKLLYYTDIGVIDETEILFKNKNLLLEEIKKSVL